MLKSRQRLWGEHAAVFTCATVALLLLFFITDRKFTHFFHWTYLVFAAVIGGSSVTFFLLRRKWLLALGLIVPNALAFGSVNPVQRGLGVITSSELFRFVGQHPELRRGKWLVFSNLPIVSGFVASTGCIVYTGTRYLPDIDHFALFAANGMDVRLLNRLGYLDAHLRRLGEPMRLEMPEAIIVQWDVNPTDAIVRELGVQYFAFDKKPPQAAVAALRPLADRAVDGFWLYRLR